MKYPPSSPLFALRVARGYLPLAILFSALLTLISVVADAAPPTEVQPQRPSFSEDGPPPSARVQEDESEPSVKYKGWRLDLNGYARLPLMISGGLTGDRRPYLIDDQYFLSGFAYTRVSEREWVETFMSATKGNTRVVIGLFTSELSDWAQAEQPKGQKGIATAFVDHRWTPTAQLKIDARVGVFWERLGYLDAYDTYLFARDPHRWMLA